VDGVPIGSESITPKCPRCGVERDNPRAVLPPGGFISIHLTASPELCDGCRAAGLAAITADARRVLDGPRIVQPGDKAGPPDPNMGDFEDRRGEARGWYMTPPRWFAR
jgi:hypothetical protein